MAKLTVLKNHRINEAVYIKGDTVEVTPDEAVVLLTDHADVFEPQDFDPDDQDDPVGARYQLFIDGRLKIAGRGRGQ